MSMDLEDVNHILFLLYNYKQNDITYSLKTSGSLCL